MPEPLRVIIHNAETQSLARDLHSRFPDVEVGECNTYEALPLALETFRPDVVYTVRFDGSPGYPRDALMSSPGLRWIANGGAGTDHLGKWDTSRVTVTNAAGVAADMMAEYVIGGFLHFMLDVPGLQIDQKEQIWRDRFVRPMKGKTLLVVGLGHTGRAIAERAKAFGMTVLGTRAHPVEMEHADEVFAAEDLHMVLPRADFISISTPLTQQTKSSFGVAEFDAMKSGVIFADVSRGGVVDQSALFEALTSGKVAAAVLDVFEVEPLPADSPFWTMGNVLMSPHCSSVFEGWEQASFNLFLNNLERWIDGHDLINVVDPDRGY